MKKAKKPVMMTTGQIAKAARMHPRAVSRVAKGMPHDEHRAVNAEEVVNRLEANAAVDNRNKGQSEERRQLLRLQAARIQIEIRDRMRDLLRREKVDPIIRDAAAIFRYAMQIHTPRAIDAALKNPEASRIAREVGENECRRMSEVWDRYEQLKGMPDDAAPEEQEQVEKPEA